GGLFAALTGAELDGHRYADAAVANGAVAILSERPLPLPIPQIVVPDSRAALAILANAFFGYPSHELAAVIGITGTDGKTTTSYILENILRHAGRSVGVIGTVGIRIGNGVSYDLGHQTTPESHLNQSYLREMADAGIEHAIVESTSHGLAMHRLDGTAFRIAGVTNVTHEHLEYHKTIENYRRAKAILIERVAENHGVVVLNADDPGASSMSAWAAGADVVHYGIHRDDSHLSAHNVVARNDGSDFQLRIGIERNHLHLPLVGEFNVANALLAAGLANALGIAATTIAEALSKPVAVPGRMHRIDAGQPFNVVVDYAHTPESLTKILTLLRGLHPGSRLIAVFGSAGDRDVQKRPMQGRVAAELADYAIFTNEDPRREDAEKILRDIASGAIERDGVEGRTFEIVVDRRAAIALAFERAQPGDCVLLAGKGHEQSISWNGIELPWDETTVAEELLAERGYTSRILS
ncbi:MAG TPA: UDP-N-acetylmuramoyl-L-alanyl-D-glutamate--2,6-diaminopimelate ligase, partial [Thermomicrobiales bacterium]|nr:UDP-N-acetylmuramoyl-L-alanyl-D-glutamate--2,6-diaminopimelate ligase [Thermomicrobiales bacterium]